MGQAMARGLGALDDFDVAVLISPSEPADLMGARWLRALDEADLRDVDAVVDFSTPEGLVCSAHWCARHARLLVTGVTGLSVAHHDELVGAAASCPIVIAPNFSVGAVLAERFAALAAPYFDRAEIIEMHHDQKSDAPSGTSLAMAEALAASRRAAGQGPLVDPTTRFTIEGARGAEGPGGVRIHAVRLAGLVAHQEVVFGASGEGLTIRHDSYDRLSYVHGVALALRHAGSAPGLVEGLGAFLF